MHFHLDVRSLSFAAGIVSLILCICMIYIARRRKTYLGFTHWTIASTINCIGFVLLSLRDILPDFLTVVIANTFLVMAVGMMAFGIEVFIGKSKSTWLYISLVATLSILFLYFTYFTPNVNDRIVVISGILSVLYGFSGYLIHRYIPPLLRAYSVLLMLAFGIRAIWFLFRCISTAFSKVIITDFMTAPSIHGFTFVVFFGGIIFEIIGLILLNVRKIEIDLVTAKDEVKALKGIIPICLYCKGIRDDKGYWNQLEKYITEHSEAQLSHGICEKCLKIHYPEYTE